jgi:hypothetical protein
MAFSALLLFTSCGSNESFNTGSQPIEYYPIEVGKFQEFKVDSTFYDDNGANIFSISSFVREAIVEKVEDDFGNEWYVIERAWRRTIGQDWVSLDLWQVRIDRGDIIRTEENLEFLVLKSPIQLNQTWESVLFDKSIIVKVVGESIEMFKAWSSEIIGESQPESIGTFSFDDVVTVTHANDENLIERRFVEEKYQSGLGLVYKKMEILDTQCIELCENQSWEEKAERGFIMESVLVAHN